MGPWVWDRPIPEPYMPRGCKNFTKGIALQSPFLFPENFNTKKLG